MSSPTAVIDAAAVIEILLRTRVFDDIKEFLLPENYRLVAPHVLDLEVAYVLRRYRVAGEISSERARAALQDFLRLPIARYGHDALLERIWELEDQVSVDAAAYLALAESLSAPLLTSDPQVAAASGHRVEVVVVGKPSE